MVTVSERPPSGAALPQERLRLASPVATAANDAPAVARPVWRWRALDDSPPARPSTLRQRLMSWLIKYNEY